MIYYILENKNIKGEWVESPVECCNVYYFPHKMMNEHCVFRTLEDATSMLIFARKEYPCLEFRLWQQEEDYK